MYGPTPANGINPDLPPFFIETTPFTSAVGKRSMACHCPECPS